MSLVRKSTTVETVWKQLEYVTKGHIAMTTIFFKLEWLYSLPP